MSLPDHFTFKYPNTQVPNAAYLELVCPTCNESFILTSGFVREFCDRMYLCPKAHRHVIPRLEDAVARP